MIKEYVKGDLVTMIKNTLLGNMPKFFMAHGCNCHSIQGAGIAGQLRIFPEIFQADRDYEAEPEERLGKFSYAQVHGKNSVMVINAYTQFRFGGNRRNADYDAIRQVFTDLNAAFAVYGNESIGNLYIPRIGAGLAGGDWETIASIIDEVTPDIQIIVVDYEPKKDPR